MCGFQKAVLFNDTENIAFFHDEQFFTFNGDFRAGPFAEQDAVAFFNVESDWIAVFVSQAFTSCNNFTFGRLFLRAIWNDNPASGFRIRLYAANQYTIM